MTIVLKKWSFGHRFRILNITFHAILYSANTEASSKVNATRLQPQFVTDYAVGTICFYLGLFWKYFLKDFGFKALFSSKEIEFSIY